MTSRLRTLTIAAAVAAALLPAGIARGHVAHTVEPGESLWSIAAANGLSVETLAAANGLDSDTLVEAGATVTIPVTAEEPYPTDEYVTSEQVSAAAGTYGMSSSLVQAVASVESGMYNGAVSSAGARGVMQIIPDTWEFVDEQLEGPPLDPASADSNLDAGARYLHYLYHRFHEREDVIAGYYQGPNRSGWLPETDDYVATVTARQAEIEAGG